MAKLVAVNAAGLRAAEQPTELTEIAPGVWTPRADMPRFRFDRPEDDHTQHRLQMLHVWLNMKPICRWFDAVCSVKYRIIEFRHRYYEDATLAIEMSVEAEPPLGVAMEWARYGASAYRVTQMGIRDLDRAARQIWGMTYRLGSVSMTVDGEERC